MAAVDAEVMATVTAAVFLVFCCWLSGGGAVFGFIVVGGTVDGMVELVVDVVVYVVLTTPPPLFDGATVVVGTVVVIIVVVRCKPGTGICCSTTMVGPDQYPSSAWQPFGTLAVETATFAAPDPEYAIALSGPIGSEHLYVE